MNSVHAPRIPFKRQNSLDGGQEIKSGVPRGTKVGTLHLILRLETETDPCSFWTSSDPEIPL